MSSDNYYEPDHRTVRATPGNCAPTTDPHETCRRMIRELQAEVAAARREIDRLSIQVERERTVSESRQRRIEALQNRPDPIAALERWNNQEKCRSVDISIDDGYGATCWVVELRRGVNTVRCSETNFMSYDGINPLWHEQDGNLWCCVRNGDEMDDWPGLGATIEHAVECAEKFWGGDDARS